MADIQPIFILPESKSRETGKEAQRTNITAARMVADTVRTTLGPRGMDKMLVSNGSITITNDGVTILKEMNIEHPSAKMIVEIAKAQEKEAGDGTTTAVVIAGELLKKAEELLEMSIHPSVIAKGYRLAADKAVEILNKLGEKVAENDKKTLLKVAMTAITGKSAETAKEILADIAVNSVLNVADKENNSFAVDKNNIKIEKKTGERIEQSELINGIILDKEKVHPDMPRVVENARILLADAAIEIKDTETKAKIRIRQPAQILSFMEQEEKVLRDIVEKIVKAGANVVLCQKGIDDRAQHFLAKKKIFAVRRVKRSDIEALARATQARIVTNFDDISKEDLGSGNVEEVKIGDEEMVIVKDCKNAKSVSILLRGATEHVLDEMQRALEDAIGVLASVVIGSKIVAGAGAIEIEVARQLRSYSESLSGREQLAARAFADAIDIIPVTLAENAGLDAIDVLAELKAAHDKGNKWIGINAFTGKTMDAWKEGILEPLKVKTQAISSAAEVAIMILRIDDIIASSRSESEQRMSRTRGMGGMGMPPMM